jgi:hypothetical protein
MVELNLCLKALSMCPDENSRGPSATDVLRKYNDESLPDFCEPLTDVNQVGTFGNRPIHLASIGGTSLT